MMRMAPPCSTTNSRLVPSLGGSRPTGALSPVRKFESPSIGGGPGGDGKFDPVLLAPPPHPESETSSTPSERRDKLKSPLRIDPSWRSIACLNVRAKPSLEIVVCNQLRRGRSRGLPHWAPFRDRKSTRLNSSHGYISYAVFCLKKKKKKK